MKQTVKKVRLSPMRAEILKMVYVNISAQWETGEGDFYDSVRNYSPQDVEAALEWLWQRVTRRRHE